MKYNVRCSREQCRARDVFNMHPDHYARPRKCRVCGGTKFRVVNLKKERKSIPCDCAGYQWGNDRTASRPPHRKGSRFCWYRADGTMRMPGDSDYEGDDASPLENAPSAEEET